MLQLQACLVDFLHLVEGSYGVVSIAQGGEHGLLVGISSTFAGGLTRLEAGTVLAEAEDGLQYGAGYQVVGRLQQMLHFVILRTELAGEGQAGKHTGIGHAYLGIGGNECLLRLAHVRTTLQQRARQADRKVVGEAHFLWQRGATDGMRIVAGEESQFIFLQGDLALQVRHQRGCTRQLHLCLAEGHFRSQSAFITYLGQVKALATGRNSLAYDVQFIVQRHQLEVGLRHTGDETHLQGAAVLY